MNSLNLNINGITPYVVVPAGILLLAYTWYYYRSTIPEVAPWLRRTLRTIRMMAVVLCVALLLRPVITHISQRTVLPVVAVLADDSQSMRLSDQGMVRSDAVKNVLHAIKNWNVFKGRVRLKLYSFSTTCDSLAPGRIDSLAFNGNATNIGDNLAAVGRNRVKENIRAMALVTDGAVNSGTTPEAAARHLGMPVHTVGVGDSTPVRDIALNGVLNNEVAYRNNAVPVKVTVMANGFSGRSVKVLIKEDDAVLAQSTVRLGPDRQEQDVTLELKPETEGMHRYTVTIPVLKGEKVARNNRASFSVRVLKDKLKVLMISGYPSYDTRFTKMALDNDPSVTADLRVALPGGRFSGGALPATDAAMEAYDMIVLQDVPAKLLPRPAAEAVVRAVREHGKGLLVLSGEQSCVAADFSASPVQAVLPVSFEPKEPRAVVRDFQPYLTPEGERHQVSALNDDPTENANVWRSIPPFSALVKPRAVAADAAVLATHPSYKVPGGGYAPVIAVQRAGAGRVMQICAFPLWRWRFSLVPVDPAAAESYDLFMANTIRWLLASGDSKLFSVKSGKRIYRAGETVVLEAQLYDSRYNPRDGAEVEAVIANRDFERQVTLAPGGEPGLYRAEVAGVPAGAFRLTGTASVKGARVGADTAKVYVDDHSLEFDGIRMRSDILRRTAAASGGTFRMATDIADLEKEMDFKPEQVEVKRHWEPWNSWVLLAAIILLFSIEWVIRKRKGML